MSAHLELWRNTVLALLIAATGLVVLAGPAPAANTNPGVCTGLDSGKIDTSGNPMSITVTAPAGQLISGYCVKSGSSNNGNGPKYVTVDPPKQSVTFQYFSTGENKYKAISHYSVSYTTGSTPTEECDWAWTRQVPTYRTEYKYEKTIPAVEGVKEYKYKRKVKVTQWEYNKQTKTMRKHGSSGQWELFLDWDWWAGNTPRWSDQNLEILDSGDHGSWTTAHDRHTDYYDRDFRYVKTGQTRQVDGTTYEFVWATTTPSGGWTATGDWRWKVEPVAPQVVKYNNGDWTTDTPGAPWVKVDERPVQSGMTTEGPVRSADEPDRGNYPDVPWTQIPGSKQCTVDKPTATPVDPCGPGNATWPAQADTATYAWSNENGHLIVRTKPGYQFPGGATQHDFGPAPDSGEACPPQEQPTTPDEPPTKDGCAPGDVTWLWLDTVGDPDAVNDTATVDWTYDDRADSWTAAPQPGYFFPDGTKTLFELPADEADTCDKVIETLPEVETVDECGTDKDKVLFAAETDDWTAVKGDGNTVVFTAKAGKVFKSSDGTTPDGKTYVAHYTAPSEEPCPPNTIPETPQFQIQDECGTENDVFSYSPSGEYWETTVNPTSVVFTAKGDRVFPAGPKVSQDGKTWTENFTPNTADECEVPDECLDLPGIQPDGFPCSQQPRSGQDPWQGQPDCTNRTVQSGYIPWTQGWFFVPDQIDGPGSWQPGAVTYGSPVVTTTREATVQECPPPAPERLSETLRGCDLTAYGLQPGSYTRTGQREYVLDGTTWVLEPEADIAWSDWAGITWTPGEIEANCAGPEPEPVQRSVQTERESCALGGVETTTVTYTTDWVFNTDSQEWELGEEVAGEPVIELVPYTAEQIEELCTEVEGEEETDNQVIEHELPEVEVRGEQETAGVPTAVDAGLGDDQGTPYGARRDPLWLLLIGGGLGLIGTAGLRRREGAKR